MYAEGTEH